MKTSFNFLGRKCAQLLLGAGLTLGILNNTYGQSESYLEDDAVKFGIKGGVNFSNLTNGDDLSSKDWRVGFNAGVFMKARFTERFALQPELLYTQFGSKATYTSTIVFPTNTYTAVDKLNLGYIQLPVLAVINLGEFVNVHLGPYASYLVNATAKRDVTTNFVGSYSTSDLSTSNFNKWDYGLAGGIGFDIKPVEIGARAYYGLQNIGKDYSVNGVTINPYNNARNFMLQAYVALGL